MKSRKGLYIIITVWAVFASCSKGVDNYPAPDAGIHGSVIDDITNKPIQTEQPNGFRISLIQEDYTTPVPVNFFGKANGTFENSKVFSSKYKVVPIEGAFFPADTLEVNITGSVEVNFKVTPFLSISASASSGSGEIIVKYTIARSRVGDKIIECKSLVSTYPAVSNAVFNKAITHNLSGISDNIILSTEYTDTISGLESGKTYYVRVAARTQNALNKYNYSPVIEIKLP